MVAPSGVGDTPHRAKLLKKDTTTRSMKIFNIVGSMLIGAGKLAKMYLSQYSGVDREIVSSSDVTPIFDDMITELIFEEEKWKGCPTSTDICISILAEEVGEAVEELKQGNIEEAIKELIQVASFCVRLIILLKRKQEKGS